PASACTPSLHGALPILAGEELYPEGIPIYAEEELPNLIEELDVDECVFSYSDLHYTKVMNIGAIVNSAGASFTLLGPKHTMIKSNKTVISVFSILTVKGICQYY